MSILALERKSRFTCAVVSVCVSAIRNSDSFQSVLIQFFQIMQQRFTKMLVISLQPKKYSAKNDE
jgi:hypothetical protein